MIGKIKNSTSYYEFENLSKQKGLTHFVSTRESGNMAFVGHDASEVRKNIKYFLAALDIPIENAFFGYQVHKDTIAVIESSMQTVDDEGELNILPETDAFITNQKGKCIIIKTADCIPILLFDPKKKVIGAVHAGWKGLLLHIVETAVKKMSNNYNSRSKDIIAGIGPSLGPENFYIREDVSALFEKDGVDPKNMVRVSSDQWLLNDWEIIKSQLVNAGLKEKNIEISRISTYTSDEFFSHRRKAQGGHFITGAMLT